MLEACKLDQDSQLCGPRGCSCGLQKLPSPSEGSSAAILRSISKEQEGLWLKRPTSPVVCVPRGSWAWMSPACVLRPLARRMRPLLFSVSVQSQLLALPPSGQELKEASPPRLGGLLPKWGPSWIRRTRGRGMPRNASSRHPSGLHSEDDFL